MHCLNIFHSSKYAKLRASENFWIEHGPYICVGVWNLIYLKGNYTNTGTSHSLTLTDHLIDFNLTFAKPSVLTFSKDMRNGIQMVCVGTCTLCFDHIEPLALVKLIFLRLLELTAENQRGKTDFFLTCSVLYIFVK